MDNTRVLSCPVQDIAQFKDSSHRFDLAVQDISRFSDEITDLNRLQSLSRNQCRDNNLPTICLTFAQTSSPVSTPEERMALFRKASTLRLSLTIFTAATSSR